MFIEVSTRELTGNQLDWAVAKAVNVEYERNFKPSKSFFHLQRIMLENDIETEEIAHSNCVTAFVNPNSYKHIKQKEMRINGENIRVAASRLIVLLNLGENVSVPVTL